MLKRSFFIFIVLLAFWILLIVSEVKFGLMQLMQTLFFISLPAAWGAFFWANLTTPSPLNQKNSALRKVIVTSIIWLIAVFLGIVLSVNFKLMIGGNL